ncbi:hypothetical protein AYO20_02524 [Fonsecaea nubica]|uniref:Uncharacterized protein n=1 Tax=Fonsecaea nubica TaxID=856822 RepID=A0A178D903_9EURO|nr:hypothetical protein AYO20_02524 [Fonsecaea nubica]OAL38072.1 hypothetical protein AYO20_02524 [Fonsecaea nubica]
MAGVGADADSDADVDAALASPSDMDETEQDVVDPMFKADPDADIDAEAEAEAEAVADADPVEPPLPDTGPGTTGAKAKAKAKSDSGSGSGSDDIAVRLNKLISTTAGLGSLLATVNFSANLAIYLSVRLPVWWSALVSRHVTRTRRRQAQGQGQGQQVPVAVAAAAIAATTPPVLTSLASLASLISDWRKSQRLTGLIPLYTRLRLLISTTNPAIQALDPVLRGLFLVQCHAYIIFQAVENLCHLQNKGLLPASAASLVERRGGFARWALWSYRAWCLGVVTNFLRLAREVELVRRREGRRRHRQSTSRHGDGGGGGRPDGDGHEEGEGDGKDEAATEEFYRKFWNDILISACWLPIALHISLPPRGIRGMNPGISSTLSLVATVMGLRSHWRATAA